MFINLQLNILKLEALCPKILKNNLLNLQRNMSSSGQNTPKVIAIGQMRSTNDKNHNLNQVKEILQIAKDKHASFVFFPECCDYVGTHREETLKLSEPLTGLTVSAYRSLARENNMWLSFGGVHESILEENEEMPKSIFNTHIIINNLGDIVAKYRKLHMFNVVTPEFKFRESETVTSGSEIVPPVQTPIGNVGLQICYDMRFPEVSTLLRKLGATILTYPSAFAMSTGKAHWEVLLRARAIENQCFVVAAAQIGFHNKKRESYGHAMIVNPWGTIIAQTNDEDLDVAVAELDFEKLDSVRQNMPCFDHRRDDIYNLSYRNAILLPVKEDTVYDFGGFVIPKETVFYSTEYSYAFTNIRCVVPGHVLVATKRKTARLIDLSPPETADFFQTVCKLQKACEKLYDATSSTVTVQDGPEAGQTVKHVHCHIMPRHFGDFEENDQIYIELNKHDKDEEKPRRSLEEMAKEAEVFRQFLCK